MSLIERYAGAKIDKDVNGGFHYLTTIIPPFKNKTFYETEVYVTKDGDSLPGLAYRFYGNAKMWWVIAEFNDLANGGYMLKPGLTIEIPKKLGEYNLRYDFENENWMR